MRGCCERSPTCEDMSEVETGQHWESLSLNCNAMEKEDQRMVEYHDSEMNLDSPRSWYADRDVNWFPLRMISSSLSVAWNNWINKSYLIELAGEQGLWLDYVCLLSESMTGAVLSGRSQLQYGPRYKSWICQTNSFNERWMSQSKCCTIPWLAVMLCCC